MSVLPISAFTDNYIWAIVDADSKLFDCVDPGEAGPVLEFAKTHKLLLRSILLTHHHNDHIGGVGELIKIFPSCEVYGPEDSRIPYSSKLVKKDDVIHLGPYQYKVLSNPGHTSTHISYLEPKEGWLFCGDTLFSAGCGRVFDGTMEELHQSLLMFKKLPKSTKIYCGHEYTIQNLGFAQAVEPKNSEIKCYTEKLKQQKERCTLPSTIEQEHLINPFFRTDANEVKEFAMHHGSLSNESLEVFRTLRNEKNIFK